MCGRFATTRTAGQLELRFNAELHETFVETAPRWNVAPTMSASVILARHIPGSGPVRQVATARWGLVPGWAKDLSMSMHTFNARSETVAEKPSFRSAFARRRAVVPVDGFYEWGPARGSEPGTTRSPHWLSRPDGLSLAGLHESWRAPDGTWILSFTVLTTQATGDDAWLHHRAPLLVPDEALEDWLAPEPWPEAIEQLEPAVPSVLDVRVVSTAVNSVTNDGPGLLGITAP